MSGIGFVVDQWRIDGDRHYRHFYGMGYSPKHAEDYVCSEQSYNLAQYHDYQIVEVVPLGQWASYA